MDVYPSLCFDGRCEEAVAFYRRVLGAEVTLLLRFQDGPEPLPPGTLPPGSEPKVMHTSVHIGETIVMASDEHGEGRLRFQGFALSLTVADATEAERVFAALADGGQVQRPLAQTFWSPRFGMVADRVGVSWMITVAP